jgi:hypothetical protein
MKRFGLALSIITLVSPQFVFAEGFSAFQARAQIELSGELNVHEEFIYDFGEVWRHGVKRDVVTVGSDGRLFTLENVHAKKSNGDPWQVSVDVGNVSRITIGDPTFKVNGTQYYGLTYKLGSAAQKSSYTWTVLPSIREPVDKFRADLALPRIVAAGEVAAECVKISVSGATSSCVVIPMGRPGEISFFRVDLERLDGAGVILRLSYPKGFIATPSLLSPKAMSVLRAISVTIVFVTISIVFWVKRELLWPKIRSIFKKRSDPERFGYLARSIFVRGHVDKGAVVSAIVDLADRGYLALDPRPQPAGLGEFIDYAVASASNEIPDGADGLLAQHLSGGVDSLAKWMRDELPLKLDELDQKAREDLGSHILKDADTSFPTLAGFRI